MESPCATTSASASTCGPGYSANYTALDSTHCPAGRTTSTPLLNTHGGRRTAPTAMWRGRRPVRRGSSSARNNPPVLRLGTRGAFAGNPPRAADPHIRGNAPTGSPPRTLHRCGSENEKKRDLAVRGTLRGSPGLGKPETPRRGSFNQDPRWGSDSNHHET